MYRGSRLASVVYRRRHAIAGEVPSSRFSIQDGRTLVSRETHPLTLSMKPLPSDQRFKLTASNVARYFKHKCDRLFRWDAVATGDRQRNGIGWNVPKKDRSKTPPRVRLLMGAGDEFERTQLEKLEARLGTDRVRIGDIVKGVGGREVVAPLSLEEFRACFDGGDPARICRPARDRPRVALALRGRLLPRTLRPRPHPRLAQHRPTRPHRNHPNRRRRQ